MKQKSILTTVCIAAACFLATPTIHAAAPAPHAPSMGSTTDTVNAMCPIGKEPIVASAGTVEYKGNTVGLCCPGCGKAFLAWDESRKDAFIAAASSGKEAGTAGDGAMRSTPAVTVDAPQAAAPDGKVIPYMLDICIIGNSKLGGMGDPVVKVYKGREVKFCCAGCIPGFESDVDANLKKIDAAIAKDQMRYYPTDRCIVTDEPLFDEEGKDVATSFIHNNRLVRTCCRMCANKFRAAPERYMKQLDKLVVDAQRESYPMENCIVADTSKLGGMGEPSEMIVGGRLMRFCCAGCHGSVEKDPMSFVAKIDKAWQAKGKFKPAKSDG